MNLKAFTKYLATGEHTPAMDAVPVDLTAHDRRFHPNGFNPKTDTCKLRETLASGDATDTALIAAEESEKTDVRKKYFLDKMLKESAFDGNKRIAKLLAKNMMTKAEYLKLLENDEAYDKDFRDPDEYGDTPNDNIMHLFDRGCEFVTYLDKYQDDFRNADFTSEDFDVLEDIKNEDGDYICPDFMAFEYTTGSKDRSDFQSLHNHQLQIGFGDNIEEEGDVPKRHKFEVVTLWYRPVYKKDIVEAEDENEAESKVTEMYEGRAKSRSDSDEMFDSIESVHRA